ncbi:hypothetical protein BC834DRAFT_337030 [Gloeopeniophorella convolvens]|nr:hypothetical protein BC834DRAFT_337030 [Gloeopeniophorella convolvens]
MLAMIALPHPSTPGTSSDAAPPWHRVRAWISRERGRAGKMLQVALCGAKAGSSATGAALPRPRRTAVDDVVWDNRPSVESRLRDTQMTMFDWVNVRGAGEYRVGDGVLPAAPPQAETAGRIHFVKRKPVPSLDLLHDEGLHESGILVKAAGPDTEKRHETPYTWPVSFPASPHDLRDSMSDQEDSDQDSFADDMDYVRGDSIDSEDEMWDRGLVVAEMCNRWGWTLEDALEALEQPGQEGRRKCSREKGVRRA